MLATDPHSNVLDRQAGSAQRPTLRALQLGVGWFPEQAGNGLDRVYHALVQHLPQAGVQVQGLVVGTHRVTLSSRGSVDAVAAETERLPLRLLRMYQAARRELRTKPYDVVAGHFALYTAPVLNLLEDCPLVVHFHGPWAAESRMEGEPRWVIATKALVEQMVYRRGTRFIVLSEAFRDVLQRDYRVPPERVRIVPGGTDVECFDTGLTRAQAREQLAWPLDRPIVLSVRRLVRRVGLEHLITAFQQVQRQVPGALLYIAGKGPLEAELRARIRDAGLEEQVRLLGFVPDDNLPLAYRAANLSVVPTAALEGFGLIAVESLAAGTPVLVTPVGGLPEVVRGLSEHLIMAGSTPQVLADHVTQALQERLPLPSAATCQAYARSHFDWPVIALQVRRVYEEVAA